MARSRQFNEEEVLLKAVDLFWKKGYHATSIEDMVKNLGINRASLYDTFGGKRQLFERAIKKYIEENELKLHAFLKQQNSVREGVFNLFKILVDTAIADCDLKGCFVVNTSTDLVPDDREMAMILQANKINFEQILCEYLKKGQQNAELDPDLDVVAVSKYLVALFNGLKVTAKVTPEEAELHTIINTGLSILNKKAV